MKGMTKDDVLKMEAGVELDRLVATNVMGIKLRDVRYGAPPAYSKDIAAAWQVVSGLHNQWAIGYDPGGWGEVLVFIMPKGADDFTVHTAKFNHPKDAALAICRAALLAAMEDA